MIFIDNMPYILGVRVGKVGGGSEILTRPVKKRSGPKGPCQR